MAKPKKKISTKKPTGKSAKPARKTIPKVKPRLPAKANAKPAVKAKKVVQAKTTAKSKPAVKAKKLVKTKATIKAKKVVKTKPVAKPKSPVKIRKIVKTKPAVKAKKALKTKTSAKPKSAVKAKKVAKTKAAAKPIKTKIPATTKKGGKTKKTTKPAKQKTKAVSPKAKPASKPAKRLKPAAKTKPAAAETKSQRIPILMEKSSKKNNPHVSVGTRKAATKPIGFSLDEVRAIANTVSTNTDEAKPAKKSKAASTAAIKALADAQKPAKPNHVQAASLADILGFNPTKSRRKKSLPLEKPVAEKHKRYYKLLLDMRAHLTAGIELHSEATLKRSAKDDNGDLSSYGQHMADAGTDTSDRDFALSLVSSEQEALSEIEAAINRVYDGSYGICEITGKSIGKDRLLAVPFTRYSTEAQKHIERNRHRSRTQAGLFGELGEDAAKLMDTEDGNS